jgi:hypothetical protein
MGGVNSMGTKSVLGSTCYAGSQACPDAQKKQTVLHARILIKVVPDEICPPLWFAIERRGDAHTATAIRHHSWTWLWFSPELFVDNLQHDAAGVPSLQHRLSLEDVMRPLARVDGISVTESHTKAECSTSNHDALPIEADVCFARY